jgi:hypothetical protein
MQRLSLREAAERSGTNKSTILRAIQAGRLKAVRNENKEWLINLSDLQRLYPQKGDTVAPQHYTERGATYDAMAKEVIELRERCATYESQLSSLLTVLEFTKNELDMWQRQAAKANYVSPYPPLNINPPGGEGLGALVFGVAVLMVATMAATAAIVGANEHNEFILAATLGVTGLVSCLYYVIRAKAAAKHFNSPPMPIIRDE